MTLFAHCSCCRSCLLSITYILVKSLNHPNPIPVDAIISLPLCPAGSIYIPHGFNSTVFPQGRKSYGISFRAEMGEIWSLCVVKRNDFEERYTELLLPSYPFKSVGSLGARQTRIFKETQFMIPFNRVQAFYHLMLMMGLFNDCLTREKLLKQHNFLFLSLSVFIISEMFPP